MKNYLRGILICLIAFTLLSGTIALTGCNSSDDSDESVSGQVADGYLYNAKVCLDTNENKACDDGEPSARSGEEGKYTLEGVSSE